MTVFEQYAREPHENLTVSSESRYETPEARLRKANVRSTNSNYLLEKGEWSARCCGARRWRCAGTSALKKAGNAGNAREATEGTVAGAPRREWRAV